MTVADTLRYSLPWYPLKPLALGTILSLGHVPNAAQHSGAVHHKHHRHGVVLVLVEGVLPQSVVAGDVHDANLALRNHYYSLLLMY